MLAECYYREKIIFTKVLVIVILIYVTSVIIITLVKQSKLSAISFVQFCVYIIRIRMLCRNVGVSGMRCFWFLCGTVIYLKKNTFSWRVLDSSDIRPFTGVLGVLQPLFYLY